MRLVVQTRSLLAWNRENCTLKVGFRIAGFRCEVGGNLNLIEVFGL